MGNAIILEDKDFNDDKNYPIDIKNETFLLKKVKDDVKTIKINDEVKEIPPFMTIGMDKRIFVNLFKKNAEGKFEIKPIGFDDITDYNNMEIFEKNFKQFYNFITTYNLFNDDINKELVVINQNIVNLVKNDENKSSTLQHNFVRKEVNKFNDILLKTITPTDGKRRSKRRSKRSSKRRSKRRSKRHSKRHSKN